MAHVTIKYLAIGLFSCLAFALPAQAETPKPDRTTATYGAWTLTCLQRLASKVLGGAGVLPVSTATSKPAEKRVKICEVSQSYSGPVKAQLAFAPSPKDPEKTLASFRAPVDVFLPFNPSIAVDDKEIAKGQFLRCVGRACIAHFVFDKVAMDAFNAAKSGTLVYKMGSGSLRSIPISGSGLSNAIAAYQDATK